MDEFSPTNDDYYSARNSYKVDIDDAGVALTGRKSNDDQICHFYLIGQRCHRGVFCKFAHPNDGQHRDTKLIRVKTDEEFDFSAEMYAVEVTLIDNPIHFYAVLTQAQFDEQTKQLTVNESKVKERCDLHKAMQQYYKDEINRFGTYEMRALGEVVAARESSAGEWHRGQIQDIMISPSETTLKVFYVDRGNWEWLCETDVRDLMEEFMQLPFQAHECTLANCQLNPDADVGEATEFFSRRVLGKSVYANLSKQAFGSCLQLHMYDVSNPMYELNINNAIVYKEFCLGVEDEPEISDNQQTFEPG